jgi:hypothetical protein
MTAVCRQGAERLRRRGAVAVTDERRIAAAGCPAVVAGRRVVVAGCRGRPAQYQPLACQKLQAPHGLP